LGAENGIFVLTGAEVTTKEEVHCLTFFDTTESLNEFQQYLSENLPLVKNNSFTFGHQVVVDEYENIVDEIDSYLGVGLNQSIEQVRAKVRDLNGFFIPAHVDRPRFGILSQLGFMPEGLNPDAIEIYGANSKEAFLDKHPEFANYRLIKNSDAHYLDQIGQRTTKFVMEHISFQEIAMALRGKNGREVIAE
jgi:hypothetical protein